MRMLGWVIWMAACAGSTDDKDSDTDGVAADADTDSDADADADTDTDADADADTAATPCALRVEAGNGVDQHVPVLDGNSVTVVHGIQGGWHVDVSGLVGGTSSQVGILIDVVRVSDGSLVSVEQVETFQALANYDGCTGTFFSFQALVNTPPYPPPQQFICELVGEELDLVIDVRDLADDTLAAQTTVRVVAVADASDPC